MSIEASISLDHQKLVWPQTTTCRTILWNDESDEIAAVNPRNRGGSPTIRCRSVESGEASEYADRLLLDELAYPRNIPPGAELGHEFPLSRLFCFPKCGTYELTAIYELPEGRIESPPAVIEVVPSKPVNLATATRRGTAGGDVFCAWTNEADGRESVWLSLIATGREGRFAWSEKIADVEPGAVPVLSVPASTIPTCQYIGWIAGKKLEFGVFSAEGSTVHAVSLPEAGWKIVPPILEDVWKGSPDQKAEALLLKPSKEGFQLRLAVLDGDGSLIGNAMEIGGAAPEWNQTVQREDGHRYSFFLSPETADGEEFTALTGVRWQMRSNLWSLVSLARWPGKLLSADVTLNDDQRIFGSVLCSRNSPDGVEYSLHGWWLNAENRFGSDVKDLRWDREWNVSASVVRTNGDGTPHVLLKGGPAGNWHLLADELSAAFDGSPLVGPVTVIFMGAVHPAVLAGDGVNGLKLHYHGPKIIERPRG